MNVCTPSFCGVFLVNANIRSQWQAHFLQIFPVEPRMSELPKTHESDKECFEKFWKGPEMSFEIAMKTYWTSFS